MLPLPRAPPEPQGSKRPPRACVFTILVPCPIAHRKILFAHPRVTPICHLPKTFRSRAWILPSTCSLLIHHPSISHLTLTFFSTSRSFLFPLFTPSTRLSDNCHSKRLGLPPTISISLLIYYGTSQFVSHHLNSPSLHLRRSFHTERSSCTRVSVQTKDSRLLLVTLFPSCWTCLPNSVTFHTFVYV